MPLSAASMDRIPVAITEEKASGRPSRAARCTGCLLTLWLRLGANPLSGGFADLERVDHALGRDLVEREPREGDGEQAAPVREHEPDRRGRGEDQARDDV